MNGQDHAARASEKHQRPWSTKKKDDAPKGLFHHPGGGWGIRYVCGAGHVHQTQAGPSKTDALRQLSVRRLRVHDESGWCPRLERQSERECARVEQEREARRVTFRVYAEQYVAWATLHHRGAATEKGRVNRMVETFGDAKLDTITTADVERLLDGLVTERTHSTVNRYRTTLHAMLNRAIRHGLLLANPARGTTKFKEPEGRTLYLTPEDEAAVRDQLAPEATATGRPMLDTRRGDLRPLFTVSLHTGLRWSEQRRLEWRDADFLTGLLTVRQSKSGHARQIPMNSVVRSALLDLAGRRRDPDDPEERVFRCPYVQPDRFFPNAVERAQAALREAGTDASRLDGYTWHCNRHSFASRLVMAGVDLRSVQVLGGWRTLMMVQRYSHLAPAHLRAAVERLVSGPAGESQAATALRENFESTAPATAGVS
jgi:site-specific recombinase XerD